MMLRSARPGDERDVSAVHVRSWQVGYRGILDDAYLDALRPNDRASVYTFADTAPESPHTILAVHDGAVLGFATCSPSHDADRPASGELIALYVDPDSWHVGVGRALLVAARTHLRRTHDSALLWVLMGNERAQAFYRRDGWSHDGTSREGEAHGAAFKELRFERRLR